MTAETGIDDTLATLRRFVALSTDADIPTFTLGGYADTLGAVAKDEGLLARGRALGGQLADVLLGTQA